MAGKISKDELEELREAFGKVGECSSCPTSFVYSNHYLVCRPWRCPFPSRILWFLLICLCFICIRWKQLHHCTKPKIRISKLFKWHLDSGLKWHWLGNSRLLFVKWLFCNVVISPLNCMWVLSYNSLHCSCSETHLGFSFELMKILASLVAWRLNCPHCLQTRNRLLQL